MADFRKLGLVLSLASGTLMAQNARNMAAPGTVNYTEGSVSIDGAAINTQKGHPTLQRNQVISTGAGKAEVLLSPGTFVRVGDNSEVRMISPELVDPRIEVIRGNAMVEVDSKIKEARIDVVERGADASILKQGLYRFDSDQGRIAVIDGKLHVTYNDRSKEFGKGKELVLNNTSDWKPVNFDRNAKDDLYVWSDIRSNYLAEANASTAQYIYNGFGSYVGSGWYWNAGFGMYSWLPGDGFFYSPFGYPFYSVGYIPVYRGFRGGAYRYRPLASGVRPHAVIAPRAYAAAGRGFSAAPRFAGRAGGFHGGLRR